MNPLQSHFNSQFYTKYPNMQMPPLNMKCHNERGYIDIKPSYTEVFTMTQPSAQSFPSPPQIWLPHLLSPRYSTIAGKPLPHAS